MNEFIKILKDVGLVGLVVAGLTAVGIAVNTVVPWQYLTYFFVIMRNTTQIANVVIDMPTLWTAFGVALSLEIALWGFKAVMAIVYWFKKY